MAADRTQVGTVHLIAQQPAEKSGKLPKRVRVPDVARDFSPRVNFQRSLSCSVCIAPVCNLKHQHLSTCSTIPTQAAIPLSGHTEILHAPIGMGNAAFVAAAVPHLGKAI